MKTSRPASPSRTSMTVAASRGTSTSDIDDVAEPAALDGDVLEATSEDASYHLAHGRQEERHAEEVGHEARREHERAAEEDEEGVDDLGSRDLAVGEPLLDASDDAPALTLH